MRIINIKNTGTVGTWVGQVIAQDEIYTIQDFEHSRWVNDTQVMQDISSGLLVVNDGDSDLDDPVKGWSWLKGSEIYPLSELGNKVAVHQSPKPESPDGYTVYSVWSGAGDIVGGSPDGDIGGGDLLEFIMTPSTAIVSKQFRYHPDNGRFWIHEGYLRFENGGAGDYMEAYIMGDATPLQTSVNLTLKIVDTDKVVYAAGSPSGATHGFADPNKIILIPRTFSKDGSWDYDGVSLIPNFTQTGNYDIHTVPKKVHKFFNRIPCLGSTPFFSMTSDETFTMPPHYYLEITAYNISNTTWNASVMVEIYRERSFRP